MDTVDRFRGALAGLAVGEMFGLQLQRLGDPFHTPVPLEPPLRWDGGTQLAMYAARALSSALEDDVDVESIARCWAAALINWEVDANTEYPDSGTKRAIGRVIAGVPWRDAGQAGLQPPSLALRAVPVGLPFMAEDTLMPARVLTSLTHQDATGAEAAAFTAWLVSRLVRGAIFDRALVQEGREWLADVGLGGSLADALADALGLHARLADRPLQWLPIDAVSPGDGGRRAESAVGLAVAAALLAPPDAEGFLVGIELAARLHGDNAAVAGLAGAFLGASRGLAAIPRVLVEPLVSLDVLIGLADALHDDALGLPVADVHDAADPHASAHTSWQQEAPEVELDDSWEGIDLTPPAPPPPEPEGPKRRIVPTAPSFVQEGVPVDPEAAMEDWRRHHRQ